MTASTTTTTILVLSLLLGLASSFRASLPRRSHAFQPATTATTCTPLYSTIPLGAPPGDHAAASSSEIDAAYLMAKAQECAFSDSSTVQEAKYYLRELMHIQSGCVIGTLASRSLCENQEQAADIVVHLQARLENSDVVSDDKAASSSRSSRPKVSAFGLNASEIAVLDPPVSLQLAVFGAVSALFTLNLAPQ